MFGGYVQALQGRKGRAISPAFFRINEKFPNNMFRRVLRGGNWWCIVYTLKHTQTIQQKENQNHVIKSEGFHPQAKVYFMQGHPPKLHNTF